MKHCDSMTGRLRAWFSANPVEMLTYDDIAARFAVTREQAVEAVTRLVTEGTLQRAVCVSANPNRRRRSANAGEQS